MHPGTVSEFTGLKFFRLSFSSEFFEFFLFAKVRIVQRLILVLEFRHALPFFFWFLVFFVLTFITEGRFCLSIKAVCFFWDVLFTQQIPDGMAHIHSADSSSIEILTKISGTGPKI